MKPQKINGVTYYDSIQLAKDISQPHQKVKGKFPKIDFKPLLLKQWSGSGIPIPKEKVVQLLQSYDQNRMLNGNYEPIKMKIAEVTTGLTKVTKEINQEYQKLTNELSEVTNELERVNLLNEELTQNNVELNLRVNQVSQELTHLKNELTTDKREVITTFNELEWGMNPVNWMVNLVRMILSPLIDLCYRKEFVFAVVAFFIYIQGTQISMILEMEGGAHGDDFSLFWFGILFEMIPLIMVINQGSKRWIYGFAAAALIVNCMVFMRDGFSWEAIVISAAIPFALVSFTELFKDKS